MSEDSGAQSTKKSEDEEEAPRSQLLVRFNHYGASRSHAFHTVDSKYKILAAKEGDVALKRATKKQHKPAYVGLKKKNKKE